jgi:hypothetical protein
MKKLRVVTPVFEKCTGTHGHKDNNVLPARELCLGQGTVDVTSSRTGAYAETSVHKI